MKPDISIDATKTPFTSTYRDIEEMVKKYGKDSDQDVKGLYTPAIVGQTIGQAEKGSVPSTGEEVWRQDSQWAVQPSESLRISTLPTTLPSGGGQFFRDPEQSGQLVQIDREASQYKDTNARILARRGLPSHLYEVEHVMPIWAGGTDSWDNKMIIKKADHKHKTAVGNVARSLWRAGDIGLDEARRIAMNWQSFDTSHIPDYYEVSYADARKVYDEWNADPNKESLENWWDAQKRWGLLSKDTTWKEKISGSNRAFMDWTDDFGEEIYTDMEDATKDLGLAGVWLRALGSFGMHTLGQIPKMGWNFGVFLGDALLPKRYDPKTNRYEDVGDLNDLYMKPARSWTEMEPVKGYENLGKITTGIGEFGGELANMILTLNAISGVMGGIGKLSVVKKAKSLLYGSKVLQSKYLLGNKTAQQIISRGSKLYNKTWSPFGGKTVLEGGQHVSKGIPLLNSITYKTRDLLAGSTAFGIWSQLKVEEQNDVATRAANFMREFAIGGVFSAMGPASRSWKGLAAGTPFVGLGSYIVDRVYGLEHDEALNQAYSLMAFHLAMGTAHKAFGDTSIGSFNDVTKKINESSLTALNTWRKEMGMTKEIPEFSMTMNERQISEAAEAMVKRAKDMFNRGERFEAGDYEQFVINVADTAEWIRIQKIKDPQEQANAIRDFWIELEGRSGEGRITSNGELNSKINEFHSNNPEYELSGRIENRIGDKKIPVDQAEIVDAPVGNVGVSTSIKKSSSMFANLKAAMNTAKTNPDGLFKVQLIRVKNTEKYNEARGEEAPGSDVYIVTDIGGSWAPIGKLEGNTKVSIASKMDQLGVDVVPSYLKAIETEKGFIPDIKKLSELEYTMTIDLRKEAWEDAIRANTLTNYRMAETVRQEQADTPVAVAERERLENLSDEVNSRFRTTKEAGRETTNAREVVGSITSEAVRDVDAFNAEYTAKGKSNVINDNLANRIKASPEQIKPIEILTEIGNAYADGRLVKNSSVYNQIDQYRNWLDRAQKADAVEDMDGMHRLMNTTLRDLSATYRNSAKNAAEVIRQAEDAQKMVEEAQAKEKYRSKGVADTIIKKIRGERPSGTRPQDMTLREAINAPANEHRMWENQRANTNIQDQKQLRDVIDTFDARMERGDPEGAKRIAGRLRSMTKEMNEPVERAKRMMDKRADKALTKKGIEQGKQLENEASKQALAEIKEDAKAIPKSIKDQPRNKMFLDTIKPETKARETKERDISNKLQDDTYKDDAVEVVKDIEKTKADSLESTETKMPVDGEINRNPDNIKDPDMKTQAVSYKHFYEFDGNQRLRYPDTVLRGKIAEAKLNKDKAKIKEIRKDQEKFSKEAMKERADYYKNKYGDDKVKAADEFIAEYETILKKYGEADMINNDTHYANRQALRHRYIMMTTGKMKQVFSFIPEYDTRTGQLTDVRMEISNDRDYPSSKLTDEIEKLVANKEMNDLQFGYFNAEKSADWLNKPGGGKRGINDFVTQLHDEGWVVLGRPKNSLSSFWAVKKDKDLIREFFSDPKKWIPAEKQADLLINGKIDPNKITEGDAMIWMIARKVLKFHDTVNANVIFERQQLYDSKEPVNQSKKGEKYNLIVFQPKTKLKDVVSPENIKKWAENSDEASVNQMLDKLLEDGAIYITESLAKQLAHQNGFLAPFWHVKPTQAGHYINPEGKMKAILQKGNMIVMDKNLQSIMEQRLGRKFKENDIITTTENVKFGLEERMGALERGEIPYFDQEVPAESFRFKWHRPEEISGSLGSGAWAKVPLNEAQTKAFEKMYSIPAKDFVRFTNELKGATDGQRMIKLFQDFIDKYHIDIPKNLYEPIARSIVANAGNYDNNVRIENILNKLFAKKILSGGFLARDHVYVMPDRKFIWNTRADGSKGERRYLKQGESIISFATYKRLFGDIPKGKITRSPDGYLVWADTGKPLTFVSARYPVNGLDNMTVSRIYLGEHYNMKNLGKGSVVMSHEDIYVHKNGDYDGDSIAIFAVGDGYENKIPQILADAINNQPVLLSTQQTGPKRGKLDLSERNIIDLTGRVWVGDQAIKNSDSLARAAEMYNDGAIRLEAKKRNVTNPETGETEVRREVNIYSGDSKKPLTDEPLYSLPVRESGRGGTNLPDTVAWVKYGNKERQLIKTLNSDATDATKSDNLVNYGRANLKNFEHTGFSKSQFYKLIFRQTGDVPLEDPMILQALHKFDPHFQAIHKMSKSEDPTNIMNSLYEGEGLERPESELSYRDLKTTIDGVLKITDGIRESGGTVNHTLRPLEAFRNWKPEYNYGADKKLQNESDNRGILSLNFVAKDYSIESLGVPKPGEKIDPNKFTEGERILILLKDQLKKTRLAYSKFASSKKQLYEDVPAEFSKWPKEITDAYDIYSTGAKDFYSRNPGKPLSEKEWIEQTITADQTHWKYPGQTYNEYLNGSLKKLEPEDFRYGVAKDARSRMVKEMETRIEEDLDQHDVDRLVHYLITSNDGNVKNHPAFAARNAKYGTYVYRYYEVIPSSPAFAEIYYTARNRYVPADITHPVRLEMEEVGRIPAEFTKEDARAIMEKYDKIPVDERKMYFDKVEAFRESLGIDTSGIKITDLEPMLPAKAEPVKTKTAPQTEPRENITSKYKNVQKAAEEKPLMKQLMDGDITKAEFSKRLKEQMDKLPKADREELEREAASGL